MLPIALSKNEREIYCLQIYTPEGFQSPRKGLLWIQKDTIHKYWLSSSLHSWDVWSLKHEPQSRLRSLLLKRKLPYTGHFLCDKYCMLPCVVSKETIALTLPILSPGGRVVLGWEKGYSTCMVYFYARCTYYDLSTHCIETNQRIIGNLRPKYLPPEMIAWECHHRLTCCTISDQGLHKFFTAWSNLWGVGTG